MLIKFIKTYSKILTTIYIWAFCGFLIPNLELNKIYLPESTKYKSIMLMMTGTFIFTTLGYCFRLLETYVITFIVCIRITIFLENFGLFDPSIDEETSYLGCVLLYLQSLYIMSMFEQEIKFMMKISNLIDLISPVARRINKFFTIKENKLMETIAKKYIVNTYESLSVKQGREVKSLFLDIPIALIGLPIFRILSWLIVGIIIFLLIEYLGIWTLHFSDFFLLFCTFVTIRCFND
jgi:hypothetical protein